MMTVKKHNTRGFLCEFWIHEATILSLGDMTGLHKCFSTQSLLLWSFSAMTTCEECGLQLLC